MESDFPQKEEFPTGELVERTQTRETKSALDRLREHHSGHRHAGSSLKNHLKCLKWEISPAFPDLSFLLKAKGFHKLAAWPEHQQQMPSLPWVYPPAQGRPADVLTLCSRPLSHWAVTELRNPEMKHSQSHTKPQTVLCEVMTIKSNGTKSQESGSFVETPLWGWSRG